MTEHASYLLDTAEIGGALSSKYGVTADIHVDDAIFGDLYRHYGQDLGKALDAYLASGLASAEKIRDLVAELQGARIVDGRITDAMTLLDFGSGYGCVARHFRNVIPQAKLVAIDMQDKAMYFNAAHLGVQAVVSDVNPVRVNPFFHFDVVFSLSLFSHQPRDRIGPWLAKLVQFVKVGGIFLFTTHGKTTHREHLPHLKVNEEGYGFERTAASNDFSPDEHGNAITYPLLMFKELDRLPNIDLVMFKGAAWWGHQDLFVVRKTT
jgi:SAM-dependent methyltransferase